jgi:hypothetical protein
MVENGVKHQSQTNVDSFPIIEVQLDNKYRKHLEI